VTRRFLSRAEAQALCERLLKWAKADETRVNYSGGWHGDTRFARNEVTTSGSVEDGTVTVGSAFGKRQASASTNVFTDKALRACVGQAERLARLAPEDPEFMPAVPPQQYAPVSAFFDSTANLSAEARGRAARFALELARAAGDLTAAGFIQANVGAAAVGSSSGLFAYHQSTDVSYTLTVRTADGTGGGGGGGSSSDWTRIDPEAIARRAAHKATASRDPVAAEPGAYTVVLEPQAVGDLVQTLAFSLDARSSDEGRGPFTKPGGGTKLGEKIVDEGVTILSDPADSALLTAPFDGDGLPLRRQVWIDRGVLTNLAYSRFWAKKQGKDPTGLPHSVRMLGGSQSIDDLVAGTDRGLLVTRFWYLRQVDPRTALFTGLTRDGTFLIEHGEITKAIKNFRFNESPLFLLSKLDGLGREERLGGAEGGGAVVMPALRALDFHFTSLSDAV